MNKFIVSCLGIFSLILLTSCAGNAVTLDSGTDNISTACSTGPLDEPYWSNHYFDTGYGYHNMGYWGVGSWDIGSFRSNRAL